MFSNKIYGCFFTLILTLSLKVSATIALPKIIGSNMMLQRNKPVAVWGSASAGEKIIVSFAKQIKKTTTDSTGKWIVYLDAMSGSDRPKQMTISGSNTIILENILVGEVWLCSGQSNMEYTMMKSTKFAHAKNSTGLDSVQLKNEGNLNIRLFLVKRDLTKPDGSGVNKGWNAAAGVSLGAFSAVGYYFAKNLYQSLHVPVGIIESSVSGSNIDLWLDGSIVSDSISITDKWEIDTIKSGKFYHGMISPLAPYTVKGFLWYQGETNCFLHETRVYTFKLKHLINSWRNLWSERDASFYFVQIAPFNYSKTKGKVLLDEQALPEFREAQAAAQELPHTGMVITTDLNDKVDDLHPTYKWEIGKRLCLLALAHDYQKKIEYSGPVFKKKYITGGSIVLEFSHVRDGLTNKDGKPLNWFEIAGADGKYVSADAVIKDGRVIVSAKSINAPKSVRFGWHEAAQPNFYNKSNLPAAPFRTD